MELDLENDSVEFTINEKYAEKYEKTKKREELNSLKEKYDNFEDESSSDEEEDEDGVLLKPEVDAKIMTTISLIKSKNPIVYDSGNNFFPDEIEAEIEASKKAYRLKDYHRETLLGKDTKIETFEEQQQSLKNDFLKAVKNVDEDEDIFTVKQVSEQDLEKEDKEYSKFLLQSMLNETQDSKAVEQWKTTQSDPNEAFLMDFVLNRGWKEKSKTGSQQPLAADLSDEEEVEAAEEYEQKYNFRFEQEGSSQVISHARDLPGIIRRKDTSRIEKRKERKERKKHEKSLKKEELKRLKNLKMEEIKERLKKIKALAGGDVKLNESALENDFDPAEYDAEMDNAFDDDYYGAEDPMKKPIFEDEIEIDDIVAKGKIDDSELFTKVDQKEKNEIEKSLEDYYKLDYEDLIEDLPVRFKYRNVEREDYGLKPEEIIKAEDADLNQLISLKKLAPYRSAQKREKDVQSWKKSRKKKLWEFRSKLKGKKINNEAAEEEVPVKNTIVDAARLSSYSIQKKKKK